MYIDQQCCLYRSKSIKMASGPPKYKIILVGDSEVGKTSCFHRLIHNNFRDPLEELPERNTLKEKWETSLVVDGMRVKATIWDTAGAERFRSLTSSYYTNSDAAILMFDVERRDTFDSIQFWLEDISTYIDPDEYTWVMVGNKCDLPSAVGNETIADRCQQIGTELMTFTSAKTGENVRELFEAVIKAVHRNSYGRKTTKNNGSVVKLTRTHDQERPMRCCSSST